MGGRGLMRFGLGGAVFAAICCVTPLLPFVLGALGAGGLVGYVYNDTVLYLVLAGFILIAGIGFWKNRQPS